MMTPVAGEAAERLASVLIERLGSLREVVNAPVEELAEAGDLAPRLHTHFRQLLDWLAAIAREDIADRNLLQTGQAVINYCRVRLGGGRRERLLGLYLDSRYRLIGDRMLQEGTVNHVTVYPREILRHALSLAASRIVLVHNHPAGDPCPSTADFAVTADLDFVARRLGIDLADHIIIGGKRTYSFREMGKLGPANAVIPSKPRSCSGQSGGN